jgi:valyl-tRNA synthetase
MDEIGADALRFTLAAMASPGMDIPLSESRMTGYRQFINKIWNASRFVLLNVGDLPARPPVPPRERMTLFDRWILDRVSGIAAEVGEAWRTFRFDLAADRLYHFFWHEYADWYIEVVKPRLQPGRAEEFEAAAGVLLEVHDRVLRMLHPIIPFVTEELWQHLPRAAGDARAITLAAFPGVVPEWQDAPAAADVGYLQEVITTIRTVRSERGVPPSRKINAIVNEPDAARRTLLEAQAASVRQLAGLEALEFRAGVGRDPDTVKRVLTGHAEIVVPLAGIVDRQHEIDRLQKELAGLEREAEGLARKLATPSFVARAPADVVEKTRQQAESVGRRCAKLEETLAELRA